ncbi:MAG: hypothetical protein GY701_19610 [Sulfitobacter sp.]|nr:hypothetical protein [Sulfitobacter sp.]
MPELVDEVPDPDRWWKEPALKKARENPFRWVRCDGAHLPSKATHWVTTTGPGPLPDGFEVKGSPVGAPEGLSFVYVRWTGGDERTDVVGPPSDVVEAAEWARENSKFLNPKSRVLAEYVLSQIGQPDV